MDNAPPKQPDPDDRPANPATADFKNQPWYMELRNEFRSEFLDGQEKRFNGWLTIFAIVITLAGFIGFDQFNKLEKDIIERFDKLEADINVRFDKLGDDLGARVTEVEVLVDQIRGFRDKVEQDAKVVAKLMTQTAENAANAPTMVRTRADNIKNNPEASELEKAIARAPFLQLDNKTDFAIGEWENIAKRAARSDNEQAAKAWFSVGYLSQDPEAAILAYDQAIRLKPDYAAAYNNRGNVKNALEQYKAAIADYDEAIPLKPDYATAYSNRCNTKNNLKQYKEAIVDCNEAIRLKPDFAEAYSNRCNTKNTLKQYKEAIVDCNEAIRLKPDLAGAHYNRGNTKNALKQYKAAIADYDEAIRLTPDLAVAYINRGNTKNVLKQYKAAIADYDEAIRLTPDLAVAYNNRGNSKQNLKQYKAAIADYDEAIRLKPDFAKAYYNRGFAKKALGLKDEARKDFKTALELARNANNEKLTAIADQALRDLDPDGGS